MTGTALVVLSVTSLGSNAAARVPVAAEATTTAQATGPIGVPPKNWLTTGVSIRAKRAAAEATTVATTRGLRQPVSRTSEPSFRL